MAEIFKIKLKNLFETKMYLMVLLSFIFLIRYSNQETYGINKTVGWIYDIKGFGLLFGAKIIFGYCIGFAILALLKAKTNLVLSVLLLLMIVYCNLFYDAPQKMILTDYTLLLSILLFGIIFIQSLALKVISVYYKSKN